MTRFEELETIKTYVLNHGYSSDEFDIFKADYGWQFWMNDYTSAGDDEELSESEILEIDSILAQGFRMAFNS